MLLPLHFQLLTLSVIHLKHTPLIRIRDSLIAAVEKRITNTDRDITCLLSGGLDSSLITGLVVKLVREKLNPE